MSPRPGGGRRRGRTAVRRRSTDAGVLRVLGEGTGFAGTVVALSSFGLLATQYGSEGSVSSSGSPSLNIALRFYVDGWALLFALLACGIGALIFTYSPAYMHGESGLVRYYAALLAFMGSIVGVALAADLVAIFLFWELTSLASFVLIGLLHRRRLLAVRCPDGHVHHRRRRPLLLVGLLLLSIVAGDVLGPGAAFNLAAMLEESDAMAAALRERGLFLPVLGLLAIGAGTKSAQVPLHLVA